MENSKEINIIKGAVYAHTGLMYEVLEQLWKHPETGYREKETHGYLLQKYRELGYEPIEFGDIPGFYIDIETGRPGPRVLVMGEMDALLLEAHPAHYPETGAVHACGHHAQSAALVGLAAALKTPGILDGLSGSIRLMAVPAEELIEVNFRKELRRQGVIHYLGGKTELISRGFMDNCDMAILVHTLTMNKRGIRLCRGSNGCIVKTIHYYGKAAHAGSAPEKGVNALYAANLGIQAVNALRETFLDNEHLRFHPIITEGGDSVSSIPWRVSLDSFVRGASVDSMKKYNVSINRALSAAGAALGARVVIEDLPGYTPLHTDPTLRSIAKEVVLEEFGEDCLDDSDFWSGGCTDLGDISSIMPCIQPYSSGASGLAHGADYSIASPEEATCQSAQLQLAMLVKLLENGAERAYEVIRNSHPAFSSREEFLDYLNQMTKTYDAVKYREDGSVELHFVCNNP